MFRPASVTAMAGLIVFSIFASVNSNLVGQQAKASESESLIESSTAITRSFSSPLLWFEGESDAFITQTITWYPNGTTYLADDKGSSFAFTVDASDGASFSLLANSDTVDQKVRGEGFEYDIYWKPVRNSDGYVEKYKFDIVGTSENGHTIRLPIKTEQENVRVQTDRLIGISENYNLNSTLTQGIGLDWSDAVSQGYDMRFNSRDHAIELPVGQSYLVDPTTVDTISVNLSPNSSDYYEGETRLVKIASTLFLFYYDSSNISYRFSEDNGDTWSNKTSLGTGSINSDYMRYNVIHSKYSNTDRITLLYWNQSSSNTDFYASTYTVNGTNLTLFSADKLFTIANFLQCAGGTCAAAVGSDDTNSTIHVAFRYIKSGSSTYYYRILKSTDGGDSWTTPVGETSFSSGTRAEMALTKLQSGKMLFAYLTYPSSNLFYRIYDGSSWGSTSSVSGVSSANSIKHISSTSDNSTQGYVAFLSSGNSGSLKTARFTSSGTYAETTIINSTKSHTLPSATLSSVDSRKYVHIFSISGGEVWDNRIVPNGTWDTWRPFIGFSSPDQLASSIDYRGVVWKEGNNIKFTIDNPPHDDDEAGLYYWSRLTNDGHRDELSCESSPNDDECKIPYYIDSSVTQTGLSVSTVSDEAALAANRLNSMTQYIGVEELSQTSTWDNAIIATDLLSNEVGSYTGSPLLHCTNWPFCTAFDEHMIQWTVKLNNDPEEINFGTSETCADIDSTPTQWDVEKTLGHELFHMLGFDHADGDDKHSIVPFNGYTCTTGLEPTEQDVGVVQDKYPAGVS